MKKILPVLFLLIGCTTLSSYQPKLANPPKDMVQYNSDLEFCRNSARPSAAQALSAGLLGGIGSASEGAIAGECSALKSSFSCVDECMAAKGYALAQ